MEITNIRLNGLSLFLVGDWLDKVQKAIIQSERVLLCLWIDWQQVISPLRYDFRLMERNGVEDLS
jgi:hypothetical protein